MKTKPKQRSRLIKRNGRLVVVMPPGLTITDADIAAENEEYDKTSLPQGSIEVLPEGAITITKERAEWLNRLPQDPTNPIFR